MNNMLYHERKDKDGFEYTDKTINLKINGKEYATTAFFDRKDMEILSTVE